MSLNGLIAHSCLLLDSVPLYICTTVFLSIQLLENILSASSFQGITNKGVVIILVQFSVGWAGVVVVALYFIQFFKDPG